jgi:formate hydrogenlyase subunit 3/multisubunit Na+/H+ antiporter MnhD subunit
MLDPTQWIVWPILFPLLSATLTFLLRDYAARLGLAIAFGMLFSVSGLTWRVVRYGPQRYSIGGWDAPLGIELYADGLSVLMLIMAAVVGALVSLYAVGYFSSRKGMSEPEAVEQARQRSLFWPLWMFLWAALNALFLSADMFNLYVTLELLGLAAVALVALAGVSAGLTAAMRYLLVSLLGSLSYLLGVALLYAAFATLDLKALGDVMTSGPVTWTAIALITVGLLLKTALFPLHFWLPPAHANAPTPVSALLSALVVKASFYILLRLWFDVFPGTVTPTAAQLLGVLGAAAIVGVRFRRCASHV